MRVWVIATGDPVPIDGAHVRPHRGGLVAEALRQRGHEVLWWSATFDHLKKRHRRSTDTFLELSPGFRLALLHATAYRHNVSVARLVNHARVARRFTHHAASEPPPDLIFCAYPTIDLGVEAVRYGKARGVPVVLDARDLWPDIFLTLMPRSLRGLGQACVRPLVLQARYCFENATGITAISHGCLEWALRYAGREQCRTDAVFPLGYDPPVVPATSIAAEGYALRRLGVDPGRRIAWFIGTFGKTYDLETVLRAARELEGRRLHDVQWVISGDGENAARLKKRARGLSNVVFTGWIDRPGIAAMMEMADVGLLAMIGTPEFLPNKLFEYLAAGLPILSSLPGEAEAILDQHECGLTYKARDAGSLLAALQDLLDDEARLRRMGRNASKLFQEQYAASAIYGRLVDFLIDVEVTYRGASHGMAHAVTST